VDDVWQRAIASMPHAILIALTAAGQLRRHGHAVRFISRADARPEVEAAGFGFVAWRRIPRLSPIADTHQDGLRNGLPMLLMPMGRDQNDIALRVEARGAGLTLPPEASEAEIAAALARLTKESRFALAARRLQGAMAREITSERLVEEIEEIARP
jgi:UDP:flavonoid glycosyltransferase YjiC (YdhE family)